MLQGQVELRMLVGLLKYGECGGRCCLTGLHELAQCISRTSL